MATADWEKAKQLFYHALELEEDRRAVFLDEACGADVALRAEVESLLAADDQASEFLAASPLGELEVGRQGAPSTVGDAADIYGPTVVQPAGAPSVGADPAGLVGAVLDGIYRIEALVGRGGMGTVYRARHTVLGDLVAIKVLPHEVSANPDWLRRFVREGQAARAVRHPNLVLVHDLRTSAGGVTYMVQEYVDGRTLREQLSTVGRFSPSDATTVLEAVAAALDVAHAAGVVHRDLKPENVMLTRVGGIHQVKLLDLGIAKLREGLGVGDASEAVTLPGQLVGTPAYMSPEQWGAVPRDGGLELDGRADVYSLGILVFELLTGRVPFPGRSPHDLRRAHLQAKIPVLDGVEGVSEVAAKVVARALAKDRADRPASAGTFVGELRRAVGGRAAQDAVAQDTAPKYVERQGDASGGSALEPTSGEYAHTPTFAPVLVLGREAALANMQSWLESALRADRQVVFVTGEAGIGKTTLVEAFLEQAASHGIWIARGQCLEQYGAGEAYLPVLEGLSRLGRRHGGARVIELLRQHAPTWLVQMPQLIPSTDREALQQQVQGTTRERMLREMAEAVEVLTAENPLVLVLEDLHWSDHSTLNLISYLARRRDPARLMVIGTYRPVEVILGEHPLKGVKRELQAHRLCKELPLEYLTEETVAHFLNLRFPRNQLPTRLARLIHQRTEGNPLFMVNMVDYLLDESLIAENQGYWRLQGDLTEVELGVPENIRHLIERQIERLSAEQQRVLEGASVVGVDCSVRAISAGLDEDISWVEERCEELVQRHQFLSPARLVELPDGTITPRYRFLHAVYIDVPYDRIPAMRRAQIHRRIGECGEAVYGSRIEEIAAELAMHFEQGRDWPRAVKYLRQAAENATHRSAHHEAVALARRGLQVLQTLPTSPERAPQELALLMLLGASLMAIKGFASSEVEEVYGRARELCGQQGASPQLYSVLWSVGLFHQFRAELRPSREIAEQLLRLAVSLKDSALVMEAHRALGVTLVDLGQFAEGLEHLDQAIALYEAGRPHSYTFLTAYDSKVVSQCYAARALWSLGFPDQASERVREALTLARELSHAQSSVAAAHFAAQIHQLRHEVPMALQRAEAVIALTQEHGLELWMAFGYVQLGWAHVEQGQVNEGIDQMRRGLSAYAATGAKLWRAHFLGLLAEALAKTDRREEALGVVAEALAGAEETGERHSEAELFRIQGELLLLRAFNTGELPGEARETPELFEASSPLVTRAEACFRRAISTAREQHAKSWELRAATSLGRLYERLGKRDEARQTLEQIYGWFTEGFDTVDLIRAKALLGELT